MTYRTMPRQMGRQSRLQARETLDKCPASPLEPALGAALEPQVGPRVSSADLSWVSETQNPFPSKMRWHLAEAQLRTLDPDAEERASRHRTTMEQDLHDGSVQKRLSSARRRDKFQQQKAQERSALERPHHKSIRMKPPSVLAMPTALSVHPRMSTGFSFRGSSRPHLPGWQAS